MRRETTTAVLIALLVLGVAGSAQANSGIDPTEASLTLAPGETGTVKTDVTASGPQKWIKANVKGQCDLDIVFKPSDQFDDTAANETVRFREKITVPEGTEPYTEIHCKVRFRRKNLNNEVFEIDVQDIWVYVVPKPVFECEVNAEPSDGCTVNGATNRPCIGTNGNDVIIGTDGRDTIFGLRGDDNLVGLRGGDILCGGPGDDVLIGNQGRDILAGEGGADHLEGVQGRDELDGGPGNDYIDGGAGTDTCTDPNPGVHSVPYILCP